MRFALIYCLLCPLILLAQKPCDFSQKVTDSLGTYKATTNELVYERNFAGTTTQMYFSVALSDELPSLNMQLISRSKDFIKALCFDKNSRMYLQLDSGKIVTLIHVDSESCGTTLIGEDQYSHRVLSGYFLFTPGSIEELLKSKISLIRIKYAAETVDYIIKSELVSEKDKITSYPEKYFLDTLPCLDQ